MTMFPKKFCSINNWIPVKSVLYADSATKSPFQHLIQNALGKTRHFLRGFFKNRSELPSEIYRKQYRLPNEFRNNFNTAVTPKFKLISYRPGIIYKVTSRWYSNSLTGPWREELLKKFFRGGSGPMICFLGFALAEKKPSLLTPDEELEGVSFLIRDSFSLIAAKKQGLNIDKNNVFFNISLADLKIGDLIAKGCNAAIYSASLHEDKKSNSSEETNTVEQINANDYLDDSKFLSNHKNDLNLQKPKETAEWKPTNVKTDDFFNSQFFISHSEDNQSFPTDNVNKKDEEIYSGTFGSYNVALKVMFNYSAESNAFAIWNAMHRETLPVMCDLLLNDLWKYKKRKKLQPHPNIVEMYSAFADQLPLLPGAFKNYPQALPTRLLSDGCGRNMTLFLVMKRYHCSLKDYLKFQKPSPEIALLLLTQLLEALVHLFQNSIAHRDLKSDNILLDLSEGMQSPKLVITDFGCCLEDLYLPYTSYDIPKGGNMLLMAPEVINVEPGPFSVIDYSRADLWAAAAIAYEIFGGSNPFELDFNLKNTSCNKNDLPPFPNDAYPAVKKLILDMLHINPKMRPSQSFAATVCQILLHAPSDLVKSQFDNKVGKKAFEWMFQMSAQTYLETYLGKTEPTSVKLELCRTFCSRIQYLEIVKALQYILEP